MGMGMGMGIPLIINTLLKPNSYPGSDPNRFTFIPNLSFSLP